MSSEALSSLTPQERTRLARLAQQVLVKRGAHYVPHNKQCDFHDFGATCKERLFLAGNRCGKTVGGANEVSFHLTGNYPSWWEGYRFNCPIRAWAASPTTETTRDVLQAMYLGDSETGAIGCIPINLITKITTRRGVQGAVDTVYVKHKSGGISSLGFKSYDQGREKFQGTSRHLVHLDEEPPHEIYAECLLRLMDTAGLMLLTMTPLLGMTQVCLDFLENRSIGVPKDGKVVVQATWDDNPHLPPEEVQRLLKTLKPHELEARQKGVPSLGGGKVYPVTEEAIRCDRFDIPEHWPRCFGLDFGWSNPTAAVFFAYDRDRDIVYAYQTYSQSERTPETHAAILQRLGADWIPGVCDPSGGAVGQKDGISIMQQYGDAGVQLSVADNSVEAGLMEVLERMQTGRFKVFADLEPWWREFRLYRRDEKVGRVVKDNDHLMDATRYAVRSGLALAVTRVQAARHIGGGGDYNPWTA